MDIRKIIKEEMDKSFDWAEDILPALPDGRFCVTFCDYDISEDGGNAVKKVIDRLEGHFSSIHPPVFSSDRIYDTLTEVMEHQGRVHGFMIYVTPQVENVGVVGWDNCTDYDTSHDTIYTHEEFMDLY